MYLKVLENPYLELTETDSGGWNLTSSHFDVLFNVNIYCSRKSRVFEYIK